LLVAPWQAPISWLLFTIVLLVLLRWFTQTSTADLRLPASPWVRRAQWSLLIATYALLLVGSFAVFLVATPSLQVLNQWFQSQLSFLSHTCEPYTDQYFVLDLVTAQASHAETHLGLLSSAGLIVALICMGLYTRLRGSIRQGREQQGSSRDLLSSWDSLLALVLLIATNSGASVIGTGGFEIGRGISVGSVLGIPPLLLTLLALTRGLIGLGRRRQWDWFVGILLLLVVSAGFFLQLLLGSGWPHQLSYRDLPFYNLPDTALVLTVLTFLPVALLLSTLSCQNSRSTSRILESRLVLQSQRPSSRAGAILSLVGAACALLGFFLPLLAGRGGQGPSSEWQLLVDSLHQWQPIAPSAVKNIFLVQALFLTLLLLSVLSVLGTSVSACFKLPSSRLLTLRRLAAINGLLIHSVIGIVVLDHIGPGLVLLLLGFLLSVVGAWLSKIPRPTPQQKLVSPPFKPASIGAIVSIGGVALVLLGFFLPMFFIPSNGGYQFNGWEWLSGGYYGLLFAPPLLPVLLVLATSAARFFRELSTAMVAWRRVASIEGLIIQYMLGFYLFGIYSFGVAYSTGAKLDFGGGFVLVLLGFIVMSVGTFLN